MQRSEIRCTGTIEQELQNKHADNKNESGIPQLSIIPRCFLNKKYILKKANSFKIR